MAKRKGYRNFNGKVMKCDFPEGDISGSQKAFCEAAKGSLDMAVEAAEDCHLGWTVHHLLTAGLLYGNANPGTSICNCDDAVDMKRAYAHRIKRAFQRCDGKFVTDPEPTGRHSRKGSR
jgi:hypothetical protein